MANMSGILEIPKSGDGRLRDLSTTLINTATDPVVPFHMIQQLELRPGVELEVELGKAVGGNGQQQQQQQQQNRGRGNKGRRPQKQRSKNKYNLIDPNARRVNKVCAVDGLEPKDYLERLDVRKFEDLTTIDPQPGLMLEYPDCPPACRLIDLFCPIGYGQRGLIVSPPKAGKTILLHNIAFAIEKNHPDVEVIALLIDERPEEVTDFRRNVPCTVLASSNDHPPERHVMLAVLAIEVVSC